MLTQSKTDFRVEFVAQPPSAVGETADTGEGACATKVSGLRQPDILIPEIRMLRDETSHHLNAFRIVENCHRDACLHKQMFRSQEVAVLADDDGWNPEEQRRSRTHDARA